LHFLRGRSAVGRSVLAVVIVLLVVLVAVVAVSSGGSKSTSSSTSANTLSASTSSASTAAMTTTSLAQSSTSVQTSTSRTSSTSAGLEITNMYADVLGSRFQSPLRNYTSVNNQTTFVASVGVTFSVDINIDYANCSANSCPSEISDVSVSPSNFYVISIQVLPPTSGAGLPAAVMLNNDGEETCHFIITLTAPSTPYTGPLTVTATPS
jgi:cytoskeletal protein RodZ